MNRIFRDIERSFRVAGRFRAASPRSELMAGHGQRSEKARRVFLAESTRAGRSGGLLAAPEFSHSPCHGRVHSACEFYGPRLTEHSHLDLAGVDQLFLDGAGNVAAELGGFVVTDVLAIGDDADLAPGLDGVGLLDS